MSAVQSTREAAPPAALRPSEYTAALIQVLHERADRVRGAAVLDMGCGSGVVLAAAAVLGARSVTGIDIEADAVASSAELLRAIDADVQVCCLRSDLWRDVPPGRYDVVVANLPQFPLAATDLPGRLPTWSAGGRDGRLLLDPFLDGLVERLAPDGMAFLTHNAFIGIAASRDRLARHGLELGTVSRVMVALPAEKLARMTPELLAAESGRTIHRYGPYAFGEMHVVAIGRSPLA